MENQLEDVEPKFSMNKAAYIAIPKVVCLYIYAFFIALVQLYQKAESFFYKRFNFDFFEIFFFFYDFPCGFVYCKCVENKSSRARFSTQAHPGPRLKGH